MEIVTVEVEASAVKNSESVTVEVCLSNSMVVEVIVENSRSIEVVVASEESKRQSKI